MLAQDHGGDENFQFSVLDITRGETLILTYTAYVYWVFRGKASPDIGYTPATPGQTTETLNTGR